MNALLALVLLFPLAGAVINGLLGNRRGWAKATTSAVALAGSGLAMLAAFSACAWWLRATGGHEPWTVVLFSWIPPLPGHTVGGLLAPFTVDFSLRLDGVSAVMVFFVTFVGFLIHVYSVGYMHGESERGYARYFAYLNLFMFAMLTLVLGGNLLVLFVGWEGVGLCSYLLIGYYFTQDWCAAAGKKAFIVNRIGDFGFLLAIFLAYKVFGTVDFAAIEGLVSGDPGRYGGYLNALGLLLFVGAVGKSAQLPLYVWLPDAMAGPTPVSALIHAATMVTAGVYMVARAQVVYRHAPEALLVVAIIGGLTAVFAASIGLAQNDIKKVLAYSTVSQLGYMFLAAGAGAFTAALFHVFTHAFFKACLFLGAGSVIHALGGEQDMRRMGGLKAVMPTTYWTFLVATLALAGIPVFSGFFSKDEILGRVFAAGVGNLHGYGKVYLGLWVLGVVGAFLTAFYMFRAVHMTFSGSFRGPEASWHHAHESPPVMTWPLRILGVGSVVVGFVGVGKALSFGADINLFEHFLEKSLPNLELAHHPSLATEWALIALSVGVAGLGLWLAGRWYTGPQAFTVPEKLAQTFPHLATLLANKYYVDEIYQASVVAGTLGLSRASFAFDTKVVDGAVNGVRHLTVGTSFFSGFFDLHVVDGLVNLVAKIYRLGSEGLRRVQWGLVQGYALIMTVGFVAALVAAWMLWH